ncbi:DUF3012 domain-containing protein [Marinobacterium arenosum]|uniref:DUF3012 domain-containing protein n=1 Tax=Marinobacterium arenosum TaxID=2862496 RepID=UPI001C953947|nr:DUF3012 domain-containing protein [Marinobacterium arenosum]MBY4675102.1 DUF3012 domain-containing protein [Marinobacterium arenosum]
MKKILLAMVMVASTLALAGCGPEVGSEAWCADLKEKPKGDWSANEAAEYAKSCLFK